MYDAAAPSSSSPRRPSHRYGHTSTRPPGARCPKQGRRDLAPVRGAHGGWVPFKPRGSTHRPRLVLPWFASVESEHARMTRLALLTVIAFAMTALPSHSALPPNSATQRLEPSPYRAPAAAFLPPVRLLCRMPADGIVRNEHWCDGAACLPCLKPTSNRSSSTIRPKDPCCLPQKQHARQPYANGHQSNT